MSAHGTGERETLRGQFAAQALVAKRMQTRKNLRDDMKSIVIQSTNKWMNEEDRPANDRCRFSPIEMAKMRDILEIDILVAPAANRITIR